MELLLGILFLFDRWTFYVAWVTLLLMVIGAIGVSIKLTKKEQFRCACLGTKINVPLTNLTLVEDILMALMAGMLLSSSL
jgi:hypothetical protein